MPLFKLIGLLALLVASLASALAHAEDSSTWVKGPSFDCAKATRPDEAAICASPELSRLDRAANSGYQFVRTIHGRERANSLTLPVLRARQACGSNVPCIKAQQLAAIQTYRQFGASISERTPTANASDAAHPRIACTPTLSQPRVQDIAHKVLANLMHGGLSGYSESGIVKAFISDTIDKLSNGPYGPPQADKELMAVGTAVLGVCFDGFDELVAKVKAAREAEVAARAAAEVEAAKPENRLLLGYERYAFAKYCNDIRQGYMLVYVNDIELERARDQIAAIEAEVKRQAKDIDTGALWLKANNLLRGTTVSQQTCQLALRRLKMQFNQSSPDGGLIKKDF
jgi:uncharacterized protein YecT (DUF1311 family)